MNVTLIQNAHALTDIFGVWPSFHDAEVHAITLDRTPPNGPSLETRIHVFTMTSEVDDRGYYVLTNHVLVTLCFVDIRLDSLADFNRQNVLDELKIREMDPRSNDGYQFAVDLIPSYGCAASLQANRICVVAVEPYNRPH